MQWSVKNTFLHFTDVENDEFGRPRNPRSRSLPILKSSHDRLQGGPRTAPSPVATPAANLHSKCQAKILDSIGVSPLASQSFVSQNFGMGCNTGEACEVRASTFVKTHEHSADYFIAREQDVMDSRESEQTTFNEDEDVKTVMMKNIPCGCSRSEVVDAIESLGFEGKYEFFYLPTRRCKSNVGYAFIGFPDPWVAAAFAKAATGYRFESRKSPKTVTIVPARIQGLNETVEHFKGTRVMNSKWSPIFSEKYAELPDHAQNHAAADEGNAYSRGIVSQTPTCSQRKGRTNYFPVS